MVETTKHPEIEKAEKLINGGMLTPRQKEKVEAFMWRIVNGSREKIEDLNLVPFSKG